MLHPSRIILACAIVLLAMSMIAGWFGIWYLAPIGHGTNMHREDVMKGFVALEHAGAIDYDKAASVLSVPAFSGSTPEQRAAFEERVMFEAMFFLTDESVARANRNLAGAAALGLGLGMACVVLAIVVGIQAWRV